jgi:hypothetical protein
LRTICIGNPQQLNAFFMRKRMRRRCPVLKLYEAVHTVYILYVHVYMYCSRLTNYRTPVFFANFVEHSEGVSGNRRVYCMHVNVCMYIQYAFTYTYIPTGGRYIKYWVHQIYHTVCIRIYLFTVYVHT